MEKFYDTIHLAIVYIRTPFFNDVVETGQCGVAFKIGWQIGCDKRMFSGYVSSCDHTWARFLISFCK